VKYQLFKIYAHLLVFDALQQGEKCKTLEKQGVNHFGTPLEYCGSVHFNARRHDYK